MTETDAPLAEKAIEALHLLMEAGDSETTRVAAAKALLARLSPKKTDEEQKNESEEREHALVEARGLLAEFADLKLAFFKLQNEVAKASEASADNAAGELARLAHFSRTGLGKNAHRG